MCVCVPVCVFVSLKYLGMHQTTNWIWTRKQCKKRKTCWKGWISINSVYFFFKEVQRPTNTTRTGKTQSPPPPPPPPPSSTTTTTLRINRREKKHTNVKRLKLKERKKKVERRQKSRERIALIQNTERMFVQENQSFSVIILLCKFDSMECV